MLNVPMALYRYCRTVGDGLVPSRCLGNQTFATGDHKGRPYGFHEVCSGSPGTVKLMRGW